MTESTEVIGTDSVPSGKKPTPKWVKITAIVSAVVLVLVGVFLGVFFGLAKPMSEKPSDGIYTQWGFQSAPTADYLKTYEAQHDKETMQAKYDAIKTDSTGAALLDYIIMTQENTFGAAQNKGYFMGTDTYVNMFDDKDTAFEMNQFSTYAEFFGEDGAYFHQTASALTTLNSKYGSTVGDIVGGFARYAERNLRNYKGYNYSTGSTTNVEFKEEYTETKLAGAKVVFDAKKATKSKVSTDGGSGTPVETFELKPENDSQLVKQGGKFYIDTKQFGADKEGYYYQHDESFSWRKGYEVWKNSHDPSGSSVNMVWSEEMQTYSGFVRDYNTNNNSYTGNQSAKQGRIHIVRYFNLAENVMTSNHFLLAEFIDTETVQIERKSSGGGFFNSIKFSVKEEFVARATQYSKAIIIRDTNQYIAPYDMTFTALNFTIDVWEESGLLKCFDREETWVGKGSATAGIGPIQSKESANSNKNTTRQPFTYAEEDYNMSRFVTEEAWPGFASIKETA